MHRAQHVGKENRNLLSNEVLILNDGVKWSGVNWNKKWINDTYFCQDVARVSYWLESFLNLHFWIALQSILQSYKLKSIKIYLNYKRVKNILMTFLAEAKLSFTVITQNIYAIMDSSNDSLLLYIASIFNDL